MLNIYFKISFTHLCWGIKESSLSEEYEEQISEQEGEKFTIKRQAASYFCVKHGVLILYKNSIAAAEFPLKEGTDIPINFEEDYESFTDCITGVFEGSVRLK